jgi:hypothetical protein
MPKPKPYIKNFTDLVRAALPETAQDKPLEIWFQDEARVGQQGTLTRLWARKGSRPRAPKDCRYAWAYIFGAVCPDRATGAARVMPHANTEAMNAHLTEISRHVAPGAHALLVLDGAGWHSSRSLIVPDNITLMPLPPLSLGNLSGWWWQTRPRPALGPEVRAVAWGSSADRPQT